MAARFATSLAPGQAGATVVVLSGELGAGKTMFVQEIARTLGIVETMTSPTFVLEKVYALKNQRFSRLIHLDAYRLKGPHELEMLGWRELLKDAGNLIILEWPERVEGAIPPHVIGIRFDIVDHGRIITIDDKREETA